MCVVAPPRLYGDAAVVAELCFPRCTPWGCNFPPPKAESSCLAFPWLSSHFSFGAYPEVVFFFLDHVCFSKCYFTEFCFSGIWQDLPCCIPVEIIYKLIESTVTLWGRFKGIYPGVFERLSSESSGQAF